MSEFFSIVDETFGDLARSHGFCLVEQGRARVIYESRVCVLSLGHDDQRSFEVVLALAARSEPNQPAFTFDEILRSQTVPVSRWPQGYSAHDFQSVRKLLQEMADIMGRYAVPLLEGESEAWSRLVGQRRADCIEYANTVAVRQAKQAADIAWAARDYAKVVDELKIIQSRLSKADLAKLEYARKRAAS